MPIPIPEHKLITLVDKISGIEQDMELQRRITANQLKAMTHMRRAGIVPF